MHLLIHTDGASRGNPGRAAYAFVASDYKSAGTLGVQTNNYAEHFAMTEALKYAYSQVMEGDVEMVEIRSDSMLIVNQVNRTWRVNHEELEDLAFMSQGIIQNINEAGIPVVVKHVRREFNKEADALCNEALDKTH